MATTDNVTSSSLLSNVTRYEDVKNAASSKSSKEMGKQDFLTLFTAQLQNQSPLDPVKNEAFVAQLAQFSQLEALTNMQTSLDKFVSSSSSERMLGGAALIGKRVPINDALTQLTSGSSLDASIELPNGAAGIKISVEDAQGNLVQELTSGAKTAGTATFTWDGTDAMGNAVPTGKYRLTAKAVIDGKTTDVPVGTMATIRSISTNPTDGSVSLQLDGGKSILMSDVSRIAL
jgi:flagellar basal-body rod modification protein FlgD